MLGSMKLVLLAEMTAENVNIATLWEMTQNLFCCRYLAVLEEPTVTVFSE
jgi:hypothetical protein